MPLSAGDKLGPHEVLSLLGKGGMGEMCRFLREAKRRSVGYQTLINRVFADYVRLHVGGRRAA